MSIFLAVIWGCLFTITETVFGLLGDRPACCAAMLKWKAEYPFAAKQFYDIYITLEWWGFFSISLQQGIKLWTFIAPTFAFFSQVECKQQSDAVLARNRGQAFLDMPMFIMKRLCEWISKLSFPLTQLYSPPGAIHASEETGNDTLEKLKWTNL